MKKRTFIRWVHSKSVVRLVLPETMDSYIAKKKSFWHRQASFRAKPIKLKITIEVVK